MKIFIVLILLFLLVLLTLVAILFVLPFIFNQIKDIYYEGHRGDTGSTFYNADTGEFESGSLPED